jgi:hypothetical protein
MEKICRQPMFLMELWTSLLSRHSPGWTEENHGSLSQDSWSPLRNLNPGPPEYEAGVLTTRLRSSVDFYCKSVGYDCAVSFSSRGNFVKRKRI